jgi:anthranilate/para-aminobenzoate synthase component I
VSVIRARHGDDPPDAPPLPASALRAALPRVPDAAAGGRFPGGVVGFVTYERGRLLEGLPAPPPDRAGPDLWFGVYDTFARHDPATAEVEVVSWGLSPAGDFDDRLALTRAGELEERLRAGAAPEAASPGADEGADGGTAAGGDVRRSLDRAGHARGVAEILAAIGRGDIYQGNLTVRFDVPFAGDPVALCERLLRDNPAPHAAYLEADGLTVLSSSPELLLRVRGREAETRPIKGTVHRDADPVRDRRLGETLLASPKDRAELLMITDLMRNDLGRVCTFGSVRVPALRELESFPHVHHLVSTVRGGLRTDRDVWEALAAVFPCGSITGAPKRRAMEILAGLEPRPRDVYTGTVGWVGFDGSACFNVAIRTGILADGTFSFGAGGGIVADSTADAEWDELLLKARAQALALGVELRAERKESLTHDG